MCERALFLRAFCFYPPFIISIIANKNRTRQQSFLLIRIVIYNKVTAFPGRVAVRRLADGSAKLFYALGRVAELADALGLGPSEVTLVEVRLLSRPPY